MDAYHRDAIRLATIGVLSLGVVLLILLPASLDADWRNFSVEDSHLYSKFADLLGNHGLLDDPYELEEGVRARMPVYPALVLALRAIAPQIGVSVAALQTILNIAFTIAAALLIHLSMLRLVGDRRIAFYSAAAVLAVPGVAPYVFAHMPEALTLLLWTAVSACLTSSNRSVAPWFAGVLASLATLTKPFSLALFMPLILILFIARNERWPRRATLFCFGMVPLLSLWLVRNWLLWGVITITPNAGSHLYIYLRTMLRESQNPSVAQHNPLTHAPSDARLPTSLSGWRAAFGFEFDNLGRRSMLLGKLASEEIFADPIGFAKLTVVRQPRLYVGAGTQALYTMSFSDPNAARAAVQRPDWLWRSGWWMYQCFASLLLAVGYLLGLVGCWKGLRDPILRPTVLVCLAALVIQMMVVGPFAHTRYRFFMTPFFGILAAIGYVKLRSRQDKIVAVDDLLPAGTGK